MDAVKARHRKEQRDLQSQITQKKKSASKKTRKSVNDECLELERKLQERHEEELRILDSGHVAGETELDGQTTTTDDLLASFVGDSESVGSQQREHESPQIEEGSSAQQQKKPNRQKARLARRAAEQEAIRAQAAEEAASIPDLKEQEHLAMVAQFRKLGLQEKVVAANGHCLYSAIADQMRQLGLNPDPHDTGSQSHSGTTSDTQKNDYKIVRSVAANYIAENPDDFIPFLDESIEQYVHKIRDTGEWGGQVELMALAKTYNLKINVLQGDGRVETIESGENDPRGNAWLAYYRHNFGLGEHYNSLRKNASA